MGMRTQFAIPVLASILILGIMAATPLVFAQLNPGDIIVADIGANAVIKIDPITGAQEIISSGGLFAGALDLVLDSNGDIIVADLDLINGGGSIIKVDPITRIQTVISTGPLLCTCSSVIR